MTTGFGTSNICWVPEGEVFHFIDLHHWAQWRIDLDLWRIALAPAGIAHLRESAREGFALCRTRFKGDAEALAAVEQGEHFVASLPETLSDLPEQAADLALPQGPLTSLWLRLSDVPLESFYPEDYRSVPETVESHGVLPSVGALTLPGCDELEIPLLGEGDARFFLLTPTLDCVAEYPLPHDRPPPILEEFCGYLGNSNRGRMVNLRLEGGIATENPVAIPLFRLAEREGFATLYLHFSTPPEPTVLAPLRPSQAARVETSLTAQGFDRTFSAGRNIVFQRGGDCLHALWDLPGLESEDQPALPPILLAARAQGSRDPLLREALLTAALQAALGPSPERRR